MKQGTFFILSALVMLFVCGCETVKGVGRDIEGASSSLQNAMSSRHR